LPGHAAHVPAALAPAADEYVPAPQAAHVPLEPAPRAVENAPAAHAAHAADALAPAVVEYVPAPHGEQSCHALVRLLGYGSRAMNSISSNWRFELDENPSATRSANVMPT
jgi:hypothetical protein